MIPHATELDDTIVAIATPAGKGAIAIVRLSGSQARTIASKFVRSRGALEPRVATNVTIADARGGAIDRGLAIVFPAPHSYTGEDVIELHVHGSPVVARETVLAALAHGARLAQPGEFTRRAFLNGKLDLNEAVAVADLIDAETQSAARAAVANMTPAITDHVRAMRARLAEILEELAGAIDFPEEVPDPDRTRVVCVLGELVTQLESLLHDAELGRLVREGFNVAIVGPPNAGKSSLLNALLGEERAIVSEIPGTTRDTIEERIAIDGVPVRLVDTAGIRAHADRLEAEGIARTRRALEAARIALVVLDGSKPAGAPEREILEATAHRTRIVFLNKGDLGRSFDYAACGVSAQDDRVVSGSVRDPQTIAALKAAIAQAGWSGERPDLERPHLAALYELDAVRAAREALGLAQATLESGEPADLIAGELQRAFSALGHVTERIAAEEVLDGVFSRFCIGK